MSGGSTGGCFPFPFRACLECLQGPSLTVTQSYSHLREELATVKLDRTHMGQNVVLLKEDSRICGSGAALGTVPILQNKAFFEVNIQQTGVWGIGLGRRKMELDNLPAEKDAWLLREDGSFWADGEFIGKLDQPIAEGDTIGVAFDHVELKFFNGAEPLPVVIATFRGAQSSLYPMVYVDDSAILDVRFHSLSMRIPPGYEEIMIEKTLL